MKPQYEALSNDERVEIEKKCLLLVEKIAKLEYEDLLARGDLKAWFLNQKKMDFEKEAEDFDRTFAEVADTLIQENFCDAAKELEFYRENGWNDEEIECVTDVLFEIKRGLA